MLYIDRLQVNEETVPFFPRLEINLDRRKEYCNQKEIILTLKKYEILLFAYQSLYKIAADVFRLGFNKNPDIHAAI